MPWTHARPRSKTVRVFAAGAVAAVAIALGLGVAPVPVGTTGCTTHQCDTSTSEYGGGFMVDTTHFETSDRNADWMDYPGEATIHVLFPPGLTRTPISVDGDVGNGVSPNGGPDFGGGQAWTTASGQLAEYFFVDATGFYVTNATCAHYYARFVATFPSPSLTLFGGSAGGASLDDTWTWDGAGWSALGPAPDGLGNRDGASMGTFSVSTPGASGTYVFGGFDPAAAAAQPPSQPYSLQTWQWSGASWSQVFTAHWPSARSDAASAVLGGQLMIFGGRGPDPVSGTVGDLGDAWTFAGNGGGDWTPITASPAPSPRSGAAAATLGGSMLLFGGTSNGALQSDTWTWNGSTWSQPAVSGPPARAHASMATLGSTVILFGGDGDGGLLGDTWLWDGTTWTSPSPSPSLASAPSPRSGAAMAAFQGAVVLFGGADASGPLGDTWLWDGTSWTASSSVGPSPRSGAAMASP